MRSPPSSGRLSWCLGYNGYKGGDDEEEVVPNETGKHRLGFSLANMLLDKMMRRTDRPISQSLIAARDGQSKDVERCLHLCTCGSWRPCTESVCIRAYAGVGTHWPILLACDLARIS